MSNPQPDPRGEREDRSDELGRRATILSEVLRDETPDGRLVQHPSNRQKVEQICRITGSRVDSYDLTDDVDFDRLLRSMNVDNAVAGLYIADLRTQYHGKLKEPQQEAENEWWFDQFDNMITLLRTGSKPAPKRLH